MSKQKMFLDSCYKCDDNDTSDNLSFSFISLVTFRPRVMVAVGALRASAQEVVIVQQLLLPGLGGELRVQVADPRLLQTLDARDGGHSEGESGEGNHTVGLAGVVQDTGMKIF